MSRQHEAQTLSLEERRFFSQEFEKDLKFFQLFFLLINRSAPIKKIDLVWAEDGPAGRVGLRRLMGTADALHSSCSRLLAETDQGPDPRFCNLVNDYGRREAESCGISDRAAEQRVRQTGKPEVYRCHAGLVDIAVPVFCDGQHIATLLTGQVLSSPPSQSGFVEISNATAHLGYLDRTELEKAYWQVPVVSQQDIDNTIEVLQVFAEYLSHSWQRLMEIARQEQRKNREAQISRKEFAHLVLDGPMEARSDLRELMAKIGLRRFPNRLLVVRFESEDDYGTARTPYDVAFTAAVQAIEELCDKVEDVTCAYLRRRGVCVFLHDRDRTTFRARSFAQRILSAISGSSDIRARVGIGEIKQDWRTLAESYHEASAALATGDEPVVFFRKPGISLNDLSSCVEALCQQMLRRDLRQARLTVGSLPLLANGHIGDQPQDLSGQRHFFTSAIESMIFTAHKLGCDARRLTEIRTEASPALTRADTIFDLQEAFLHSSDEILDEVRRLYSSRREKVIDRACRMIERQLSRPASAHEISLPAIAANLGVSPGHLCRLFRTSKGVTLERYVMVQRVERAKRLLLDPTNNVSRVAELCGFSDPTYFARVFRLLTGCAPSRYAEAPSQIA